jgi:hypothetical protein
MNGMADLTTIGDRSPRLRRTRLAIVAVVALTVGALTALLFRGYLQQMAAEAIFGKAQPVSLRQPVPAAKAAPPATEDKNKLTAPGRPIEDDEPAFWSDIEIFNEGPGRPQPIVVVKRVKQPTIGHLPDLCQGLLAREVVRQGLMLSARDELGAITRDVPVGDPEVEGKPDAVLRIGSRFRVSFKSTASDPPVGRITIVDGMGRTAGCS